MFFRDRHSRYRDQLSAYIDGELDEAVSGRVEAHLETCAGCRGQLDELRATVHALAEMVEVPAPRSFTLTAEQAATRRPLPATQPVFFGMRLAAAGVAVALAAVLLLDAGGLRDNGPESSMLQTQGNLDASETADSPVPVPSYDSDNLYDDEASGGIGEGGATPSTPAPAAAPLGPQTPPAGETHSDSDGVAVPAATPAAGGPSNDDKTITDTPPSAPDAAEAAGVDDGGIGTLTAIEIGLAIALTALVLSSVFAAIRSRRSRGP